MTLIAGFKCKDGYVICADSQETIKEDGLEFRVMRKKLVPVNFGEFELSMAGSGTGPVIDGFIAKLRKDGKRLASSDLEQLAEWLHGEVKLFLKEQGIRVSKSDERMRFVIGARSKSLNKCSLWSTAAAQLIEIDEDPVLVGFKDFRYEYAVQNLYHRDITVAQGIFLGLYVLSLAEQTSNYVKRPVSVVVIRDNGIYPQAKELITELHNRVQLFASHFEKLFLSCPDTGLQRGEFAEKLNEFVKSIVHLRKEYVEEWVGHAVEEGLDKVNDPFNLIPLGTMAVVVNTTPDQAKSQERMEKRWPRHSEPILVMCKNVITLLPIWRLVDCVCKNH